MQEHVHRSADLDTEHLFGFTRGSDVGPVGHRHGIADLTARFGRQAGSYAAASQKLEYAVTPWRDVHLALGASLAAHAVSGVPDMPDRRQVAFEGLSLELRHRLLDRADAPFGLTVSAEPHWARLDEVSGARAAKFAAEFMVSADRELIRDTLWAAVNLVYEPEWVRAAATREIERESTLGVSAAGMLRLAPRLLAGAELRYLRRYDGAALNTFAGEALFAGPVVYLKAGERLALVAAYSAQLAGSAAGGSGALDLDHFDRHRAKLKAVFDF